MKFVRTKGFDRDLKRLRVTDKDLGRLLAELTADPKAGDAIVGLEGIRKIRFGIPSRKLGKSGGGRAIYLVVEVDDVLFLLKAYGKNEQADLTPEDRKALLKLIEALES